MYKVSEDNALDDIFLEKMRIDHFNKNLKMQNIVKKSFIMNEQSSDNKKRKHEIDSELDKYLSQVKKLEQEKKEVQNSSIFTYKFWKYNISRNLDLFTTLFIDANLLLILYPLTTIKTRIQAQHKYEDVAYFVKNKVLKERKKKVFLKLLNKLIFSIV